MSETGSSKPKQPTSVQKQRQGWVRRQVKAKMKWMRLRANEVNSDGNRELQDLSRKKKVEGGQACHVPGNVRQG